MVIGSGGGAGEPQLWLEGGALMFSVGLPLSRPLPLSHRFAWTPPPNGWTCAPTEPPLDTLWWTGSNVQHDTIMSNG